MSSPAAHTHLPDLAVKTLACAVIKQAVRDALNPMVPLEIQRDAQDFLAGDQWYRRWCTAAGIRPVGMLSRRRAA